MPGIALGALISWLLTESLGAFMLSRWIASGGRRVERARPDGMPPGILFGHAGLAFIGFVCWVSFVVSGLPAFAWLAIAFLAPAIGLGLSTLTVWTPYPTRVARRPEAAVQERGSVVTDQALATALSDSELTSKLVDDLLASMLTAPEPEQRRWRLAPLVPAAHGVLAIATILTTVLAAVAAT